MSLADIWSKQIFEVGRNNLLKTAQAWQPPQRPANWGYPWNAVPPVLAAPQAGEPRVNSIGAASIPTPPQSPAPPVLTQPQLPPDFRPDIFIPEKHTYGFSAAPTPDELPGPFQRDIEQDARRSLDAAGVGGLLGMLLGGGRGAALGAIGASQGFSAGRDRLAQERQRQHEALVEQIQQRNARNRQIWEDQKAQMERQMRIDAIEDDRQRSIFQGKENQRAWEEAQWKEKENRAHTDQEKKARRDREDQARIATLDGKLEADGLDLDAQLDRVRRSFPVLDKEIQQVRDSITRMPYQGRDKRGNPVTLYRKPSELEKKNLEIRLEKLKQRKGDLAGIGKHIIAQQDANKKRKGTGR